MAHANEFNDSLSNNLSSNHIIDTPNEIKLQQFDILVEVTSVFYMFSYLLYSALLVVAAVLHSSCSLSLYECE